MASLLTWSPAVPFLLSLLLERLVAPISFGSWIECPGYLLWFCLLYLHCWLLCQWGYDEFYRIYRILFLNNWQLVQNVLTIWSSFGAWSAFWSSVPLFTCLLLSLGYRLQRHEMEWGQRAERRIWHTVMVQILSPGLYILDLDSEKIHIVLHNFTR